MKIFDAIEFVREIESGGSTYPWIIKVVNDNSQPVPFVVKLFTDKQTEAQHPIAKEIMGSILASEFELTVPDFALINFTDSFLYSLPEIYRNKLRDKHKGLKFGCEYKEDAIIVNINNQKAFWKTYEIGSIFAFDNLVMNLDRGGLRSKPNLMIDKEDFILIDHEQLFPFSNDENYYNDLVIKQFHEEIWNYDAQHHLFYPYLKTMRADEKDGLFDTFHEHLRLFNIRALDNAMKTLQDHNISVGNYPLIRDYLLAVKNQSSSFIKLLKYSIS